MVHELLESDLKVERIFCVEDGISSLIKHFPDRSSLITDISEAELKKISTLSSPDTMLAEAHIPNAASHIEARGLHLLLDGVRDPGNLGTIVRVADQFGVSAIFCTQDSVDLYNPKAVQSTMGSIFRVPVFYEDAEMTVGRAKENGLTVLATVMDGQDIYSSELPADALLIMGSESHGIRPNLLKMADRRLSIPNFGGAESLNVAVATAVFCSEFRARGQRD